MAGIKGKSGGARSGAGRPSLKEKNNKKLFSLSVEAIEKLDFYSKELGVSKSDIIDSLCLLYLDKQNKDILHCPECGKPLAWESLLAVVESEVECICGYSTHVGEPASI